MNTTGSVMRNLFWAILLGILAVILGFVAYFAAMAANVVQAEGATDFLQTTAHVLWWGAGIGVVLAIVSPVIGAILRSRKPHVMTLEEREAEARIRNIDADTYTKVASGEGIFAGTARENDFYNRNHAGGSGEIMDDLNRRSVNNMQRQHMDSLKVSGKLPFTDADLRPNQGVHGSTPFAQGANPFQAPTQTTGRVPQTGGFFDRLAPKPKNDSGYIPGNGATGGYNPPMDTRVSLDEDFDSDFGGGGQETKYMPGMENQTRVIRGDR